MSITDQRPDPNTVSHEAVATVARQRVMALTEEVLLRDAKITEQQQYIDHLEARLREQEAASPRPMAPARDVKAQPVKG